MKRYKKKILRESIPKAPAYWISSTGKILPIYEENHIAQVIKNPKAFNMTTDEIEEIYNEENEKMGSEGKARERIILSLVRRGWIRIRRYNRPDMFSVNISRLNRKTKDYLYKWAKAMKEIGLRYTTVKLDTPGKVIHSSIEDISNDALFQEASSKNELIVVDCVYDL